MLSARPFSDAFPDSASYVAPFSVADVDAKFFDGARHLHPRMSPSHDAIDVLAVGLILFVRRSRLAVRRRREGKFQLMASHGEDAPIAARQLLNASGEMYGVVAHAEV